MPGIEDWSTRPYSVIQNIFDESKGNSHEVFVNQVKVYFSQKLDYDTVLKIPSLNCLNTDQLTSGSLVRYRCMVQDVFDPQFCLAEFTIRNKKTQTTRIECGTFRDISNIGPDEIVDLDSRENVPVERQGFYCVPIPGESPWVNEIYSKSCQRKSVSHSKTEGGLKRTREEEEIGSLCDNKTSKIATSSSNEHKESDDKIICPEGQSSATITEQSKPPPSTIDLNLPIPEENGTPCIVRVYSSDVELKTSDCVEFIGILSLDPEIASIYDNQNEGENVDGQEELCAHEPPTSLVPRLHAILVRSLDHNNPHLPPVISSDVYKTEIKTMMNDVCTLRIELLSILEHSLLCDRLAAEYLLCNLLARVYARADILPLGKFCLNLSGCPRIQRYVGFLYHLISQLTTKSALMEMSIDNLNSWTLIPKKNYNTNRVMAGRLQLSTGTQLVLDETALQQGQLNNTGVLNVRALEDMITWQKVDYDFQWNAIPIHTDVNVLIISEGPSFLSKDFHVPVSIGSDLTDIPGHFAKLDPRLTEENLCKLRSFITACRLTEYEVSEDVQKVMQDDFVETRQEDPNEMTVEDFKKLLTLVRLLTISYGKTCPSQEIWLKAKAMEMECKARIGRLPQPSNGSQ